MPILKQHPHYLGHLISGKGIQSLPDRILTITNIAVPKNIDELHHFLGLTGYYRKFIRLFADKMKPLSKPLWTDTKFQLPTQWQPILQYPNINKPYTLFTNTINCFFCICIQAVKSPDDLRPRAYTSVSFSNMQQRWCATEKETFMVYQSVLKWILCCINLYSPFCPAARKYPSLVIGPWNYEVTFIHIKGSKNILADAIFRLNTLDKYTEIH